MAEPSDIATDAPQVLAPSCEGSHDPSRAGSRHAPGAIVCEYCGVPGCADECGRDVARPCGEWC